jgi:predicted PurR-regulated permease PerM
MDTEPPVRTVRIEIAPRAILYVLLAIAAVWLGFKLTPVLIVVTVALVIVGTIDPLVAILEKRGFRRGRALTAVFVTLAMGFALLMLLAIPPLVSQFVQVLQDAPRLRDDLVQWLQQYTWAQSLSQQLAAAKLDFAANAGNLLLGQGSNLVGGFTYALTTLFLAAYWLSDPVRSKSLIYSVVPRVHHLKLARILLELNVIVGGYMRGQLITSASCGGVVFLTLAVLGVDNAVAFAIFAAIADIIPLVGGLIATLPVLAAVAHRGPAVFGVVLVLMFIYQEFESRFLVPRVYGRVLRLSPAIILVALLIGATLLGMLGALLAIPIAAGIQMIIRELRVDLPGAAAADEHTRTRDEKADMIYSQLAEGATAADAAVIASDLAAKMKETGR